MPPPVAVRYFMPTQQVLRPLRDTARSDPRQHDEALVGREIWWRDCAGQHILATALLHVLRGCNLLDHCAIAGMVECYGRKLDHWVIAFRVTSERREFHKERRER